MGGKKGEAVSFAVMVSMEGCTIGLTVAAKTAITYGLSPFVFVFYTNALASLILLPYSFFFHGADRTEQPLFTCPLFIRFFLLGLTGICMSQNLAFLGLTYSSPIVVCAMGLVIPSISFFLAILLRKTRIDWRSSSFLAKITGSLISIAGAAVVIFYRGPLVDKPSSSSRQFKHHFFVFMSSVDHWALGGLLLAAASLSVSVWNLIQMGTLKHYPQVMKVTSFYSLLGTVQCAVVCACVERDVDAWKIKLNLDLLLIVATAIFGAVFKTRIHLWCMTTKGPLYVPMFRPFGIVFATTFGSTVFANSFRYGSLLGSVLCGLGYYIVMWGQVKEEDQNGRTHGDVDGFGDGDEKVPLLKQENNV